MFTFRKAEMRDKTRICEISSKIWDGDDYIPNVFDEWVQDREGEFTVAEYEGVIAGFAKYTKLAENEAWIEGIRADKAYAGKGFAEAMTNYYIAKAKSEKLDAIRLSTFIENYQSIHVIEKCGFKKDGCFTYCTKPLQENSHTKEQANVVKIMSTATAWSFIENSRSYMLSNGYISNGWQFYKLHYELLDNLVKSGSLFGTLRDGRISALAIIWTDVSEGDEISISFIDGERRDRDELLGHLEHMAGHYKARSIGCMAVMDNELLEAFVQEGYKFIYEKPDEVTVFVYIYKINNR